MVALSRHVVEEAHRKDDPVSLESRGQLRQGIRGADGGDSGLVERFGAGFR